MKSFSTIYDQHARIHTLLYQVTTANIKRVHPDTGGSIHLAHNWGNEAAKQYLDQYLNRQIMLSKLFNKYFHNAFKIAYPNHLNSQTSYQ